jgi:hypothetical protein
MKKRVMIVECTRVRMRQEPGARGRERTNSRHVEEEETSLKPRKYHSRNDKVSMFGQCYAVSMPRHTHTRDNLKKERGRELLSLFFHTYLRIGSPETNLSIVNVFRGSIVVVVVVAAVATIITVGGCGYSSGCFGWWRGRHDGESVGGKDNHVPPLLLLPLV